MKSEDNLNLDDISYLVEDGIAWITIEREDKANAFRIQTVREMIAAIEDCRRRAEVRSIVISGASSRFFCVGGDHDHSVGDQEQAAPDSAETAGTLHYGNVFPVVDLYDLIDKTPKPVIAMVNGYAVGGGNVLALVCDLTIASSSAVFRQVGPIMGSFDAGFGTWYLEEAVGRKKAKEIWMLNTKYSAAEALEMGLVNEVVDADELRERVRSICQQLAERGPMAIADIKSSFHARHSGVAGLSRVALDLATAAYYQSEESQELGRAFAARRAPDKTKFYK